MLGAKHPHRGGIVEEIFWLVLVDLRSSEGYEYDLSQEMVDTVERLVRKDIASPMLLLPLLLDELSYTRRRS